jgi:hypothetical protein
MGKIKDNFNKQVDKEVKGDIDPHQDRGLSIGIVIYCVLIGLYFVFHQTGSTGFFTESFGIFEAFLFYGILVYWIVTSGLIIVGLRQPSRDLDIYGGLIFATFASAWLFVVFPFDFAYFADVLPDSLSFLVQWISNGVARVLMVLLFIMHLFFTFYATILTVAVHKERARRKA